MAIFAFYGLRLRQKYRRLNLHFIPSIAVAYHRLRARRPATLFVKEFFCKKNETRRGLNHDISIDLYTNNP